MEANRCTCTREEAWCEIHQAIPLNVEPRGMRWLGMSADTERSITRLERRAARLKYRELVESGWQPRDARSACHTILFARRMRAGVEAEQ